MKKFYPERVFFEREALDYPLGERLYSQFGGGDIPVAFVESHNRLPHDTELNPREAFDRAKKTLVVGVKKTLRFQSCKPSADYRLVTGTSCPGRCEYCYLAATLGPAVHIRVYVNIDELLAATRRHIEKRTPQVTSFEASSSSDPVAVEHLTGSLKKMITFFADQQYGRLRVVTKFGGVGGILDLEHREHTRIRFSINTARVIADHEGGTADLKERLQAARQVQDAGYPLGFIIAPLIAYRSWEEEYGQLLDAVREELADDGGQKELTFELIMHRFTTRARRVIAERFPHTELEMDTADRRHKGFGKYVYKEHVAERLKEVLSRAIEKRFPRAHIEYFT